MSKVESYITSIPDFPEPGVVFRDITTVIGDPDGLQLAVNGLIDMLKDFGILEIAKTGTIAIERGRSTIYDTNKLREEYDYGKNVL